MSNEGPMSILVSAIIEHTSSNLKTIADGQLIEEIELTVDTPVIRFHAIEQHNAEMADQPTDITWETRLLTTSKAYLALIALQAHKEYFNLKLVPINDDPKANRDRGVPISLINCKVTRHSRRNRGDAFPLATIRGEALRWEVDVDSNYIRSGDDVPTGVTFELGDYYPAT